MIKASRFTIFLLLLELTHAEQTLVALGGSSASGALPSVEGQTPIGNWNVSAAMSLPEARAGFAAVSLGSKIFVVGGNIAGQSTISMVDVSQPTPRWSTLSAIDPAVPLVFQSATAFNGVDTIYILGGMANNAALNSMWSFSITTNQTTPLSTTLTTARYGACAAFVSGIIYIIGGVDRTSTFLSSVESYSPNESLNTAQPVLPTALAFASAAVDGSGTISGHDNLCFWWLGKHVQRKGGNRYLSV